MWSIIGCWICEFFLKKKIWHILITHTKVCVIKLLSFFISDHTSLSLSLYLVQFLFLSLSITSHSGDDENRDKIREQERERERSREKWRKRVWCERSLITQTFDSVLSRCIRYVFFTLVLAIRLIQWATRDPIKF